MFPSASNNDGSGRPDRPGRPERGYPRDPRRGPPPPMEPPRRRGGQPPDSPRARRGPDGPIVDLPPRRGGPPPEGARRPGGYPPPDFAEPGWPGGPPPVRDRPEPPPWDTPPREDDERRQRASARRDRRDGLDAENAPDEGPNTEFVPVRRLLSLGVGGFAGLLATGLIFGAQTTGVGPARWPYAVVIFAVQVLYVIAWVVAIRPPAPWVVGIVGGVTAVGADLAALLPVKATAAPVGYVAAAGFLAGVIGQLSRRAGRVRATESLGVTLVIVIGVISFALLIVLTRLYLGTQAITVGMAAVGVSLVVARIADAVAPYPRLAPAVPRGAGGIVVGAMGGTFAAALLGSFIVQFTPLRGALVGLAAALAAVLADLAVGYAEAGRRLAGEPGALWLARHLQGPMGGFALAAPVVYVISIIFLTRP